MFFNEISTQKTRFAGLVVVVISIVYFILCNIFLYPIFNYDIFIGDIRARAEDVQKTDLEDLLTELQCQWVQGHITSWGIVDIKETTIEALENVARNTTDFFNIEENVEMHTNDLGHLKQVKLKGRDKQNKEYDIIINNNEQTYIIVSIVDNGNTSLVNNDCRVSLKEDNNKIVDYFSELGITPQISTTYIGAVEKKLGKKERELWIKEGLEKLGGRADQVMRNEELISIAGYSSTLNVDIVDDINFQIAMRYNGYEGKTYIWVGAPLINVSY